MVKNPVVALKKIVANDTLQADAALELIDRVIDPIREVMSLLETIADQAEDAKYAIEEWHGAERSEKSEARYAAMDQIENMLNEICFDSFEPLPFQVPTDAYDHRA